MQKPRLGHACPHARTAGRLHAAHALAPAATVAPQLQTSRSVVLGPSLRGSKRKKFVAE